MPLARTGESDEPSTRRRGGRLLLVAGVVTALGAAGVLVLSDDSRWLRLGVVAALWAALVGAFIAARYRGQVSDRDDRAADLQAVYELELEREIAARREYELQVEAEIRSEVDEQSRRDVAALRDELRTLRQTLENLLGGEVLVERYALAQSTRMRPIQERKHLAAAVNGPAPEPVTEQFERVTELRAVAAHGARGRAGGPPEGPSYPGANRRSAMRSDAVDPHVELDAVKTGPRPVAPLPRRADRTERPAWPTPVRQPTGEHPVAADSRVVELPPTAVAQFRPPAAEHPRAAEPPSPEIERIRSIAEQSLSRIERLRPQTSEPPRPPEPSRPRMEPVQPRVTESSWRGRPVEPPAPPRQPERSRSRMEPVQPRVTESSWRGRPVEPPAPPPQPEPFRAAPAEQSQSRMERLHPPAAERSAAQPPPRVPEPPRVAEPVRTAWEERPVAPAEVPEHRYLPDPPAPERSQPGRHSNEPPATGGRRRRAEPEPPARRHGRSDEETGGGRRRRAEDTPSWQELAAWDPVVKATSRARAPGSHARGPEPDASGSHATGHSVADLLAAHGTENPRRRRRREE
jgi:uncharacterized protein DUF6779